MANICNVVYKSYDKIVGQIKIVHIVTFPDISLAYEVFHVKILMTCACNQFSTQFDCNDLQCMCSVTIQGLL